MIKATFYKRDFSNALTPPGAGSIVVEGYSKNMIGGCKKATLSISPCADNWEFMKLLRCPIELYGDDGGLKWWGFVNRITIPNGNEQRIGLSLDEMYNYVIARYKTKATAASSNDQSIAEYGQKEFSLYVSNANSTQATAARNVYLSEHQYPRPEYIFSGGAQDVEIECVGWYDTLGWQYYSDSDTTNTSHSEQIEAIIAAKGQFINGTIMEDTVGVSSNEYRDGTGTALGLINQILHAGTSNFRPLLAYVDKNRYIHVYKRDEEPDTPNYLMRNDNSLITLTGTKVLEQDCVVGVWVKLKNVPPNIIGLSTMRPFFIESAEYNARTDKTTYRPADSFEKNRLARYIREKTNRNTGGGYGTGGVGGTGGYDVPLGAPPITEGSLGEPGVVSLPYASIFLSSSGNSVSSDGFTINTSTRPTDNVCDISVTPHVPGGLYQISGGIYGAVTNTGYAWVTLSGDSGFPKVYGYVNRDGAGGLMAPCASFTGGHANFDITIALQAIVYDSVLGYRTATDVWLSVVRLGDE